MNFKKFLSVILAIIIYISTATVFAFAEDSEPNPILPPTEDVEVTILYAPVISRIIYDKSVPYIGGMVLKITYYDGSSEIVTAKNKHSISFDSQSIYDNAYEAGDFTVYVWPYFFVDAIGYPENYGEKEIGIHVVKRKNNLTYEGIANLSVLSIPNPIEFFYCLKNIIRTES